MCLSNIACFGQGAGAVTVIWSNNEGLSNNVLIPTKLFSCFPVESVQLENTFDFAIRIIFPLSQGTGLNVMFEVVGGANSLA